MSGTYAKLIPDSRTKEKVANLVDLLNITNPVAQDQLHVTVVYSREPAVLPDSLMQPPIVAHGEAFNIFKNQDGSDCLVLTLSGSLLHNLHNDCLDHGAIHDYPEYIPHLTLSYDYLGSIPNHTIIDELQNLYFTEFVVEPLILDWKPHE